MAVTQEDLIIAISADSKKAIDGLDKLNQKLDQFGTGLGKTSQSLNKVESATTDWGFEMVKLNQALEIARKAYFVFSNTVGTTIDAFVESQDAINNLRNSISLMGSKDIDQTIQRFQQFSENIQNTTTVSENSALKMLAMAKAIGVTDDQAQKLVQTAADLAAVQGKDVNDSFKMLTASITGEAGELAKLAPELKNYSAEQLKQGAAIELLGDKFKGFAEAQSHTISGQLAQIKNEYQKVLSEIGGLFSEFFDLGDQKFALDALKEVEAAIHSIKPAIEEAAGKFHEFTQRIGNGFSAVIDQVGGVEKALSAIGIVIIAAFGPTALASIGTLVATMSAAGVAAAAAAANFVVIGTVLLGVVSSVEIFARNLNQLDKIGVIAVNGLIIAFRKLKDFLVDLGGKIVDVFKTVAQSIAEMFTWENLKAALSGGKGFFDGVAEKAKSAFGQIGKDNNTLMAEIKSASSGLDLGFTGKGIEAAQDFMKGFSAETRTATKDQLQQTAAVNDTANGVRSIGAAAAGNQEAFDKLLSKIEDLKSKGVGLGLNQIDIIKRQADEERAAISEIQKELALKGQLAAAQAKINDALKLVDENQRLAILKFQKEKLDEIVAGNNDLAVQIDAANKTQAEAIDKQIDQQLTLIDQKREELRLAGALTEETNKALDQRKDLLKKSGEQAKQKAPPQALEAMSKVGENIGRSITDAFAPMLGAVAGIGAVVSAADAVVSAIPDMLNQIADLMTKITDLPLAVMNGVNRIFDAVLNHIQNIAQNFIKAITGIIEGATKFLMELPKVVAMALQQLPMLLTDFLNKFPDMIEGLTTSLVEAGPEIAMSLIEFLIKDAPRIALKLTEVMAIKLPIAIIKGIIDGIKSVGGAISDLFKGKVKLFDMKQTEEDITNVVKKLSGSASRIFQVTDLANAAQASDRAQTLVKDIEEAGKKSKNAIVDAWHWVLDNILNPLGGIVSAAWHWVLDKIITPLATVVSTAWHWVLDNIIYPLGGIVSTAFKWVVTNILEPLGGLVSTAFKWVVTNILEPLGGLVSKAFKFVVDLFENLPKTISKAWQWVVDKIIDPLVGLVKKAFSWVVENIIEPLANVVKKAFNWVVENILEPIVGIVKKAFQWVYDNIIDPWNKLVIKAFTWVIDHIIEPLAGIVKKAFSWVVDNIIEPIAGIVKKAFGWVVDNIIEPITGVVKKAFSWVVDNIIEPIGKVVSSAFKPIMEFFGGIGDMIGKAFEPIKNIFSKLGDMINFDKIKESFSSMFSALDPGNLFGKIFQVPDSAKGKGTVENALNVDIPFIQFAKGGRVPGQAMTAGDSAMNDKVIALVSPGEEIISRSKMADPSIQRIVKAIQDGSYKAPMFAFGGSLAKVWKKVQQETGLNKVADALSNLDPSKLWEQVRTETNNMIMAMFKANHFAKGGSVDGDMPAFLHDKEFVMSRRGVETAGLGNLVSLNAGRSQQQGSVTYNFTVPVTIKNDGMPVDANFIKQRLMPTINEEFRRESLRGRFLISDRGVRKDA